MTTAVDHLVVAAATLEQGVAWCEARLGVTPGPGGRHVLFGTHNRLLKIATPVFSDAYLEIIAIDPEAPPQRRPRWFGLDDPALQQQLAAPGKVELADGAGLGTAVPLGNKGFGVESQVGVEGDLNLLGHGSSLHLAGQDYC